MKDRFKEWKPCCPPGWHGILDALSSAMWFVFQDEWDKYIKVTDVKEKYGELRVYYDCLENAAECQDDAVQALVVMAEHMSCHVCQNCGNAAKLRCRGGWYYTECDECEGRRG